MRDPLLMEPKALHSGMILRPIRREDDPAMARIIRQVMTEFSAVGAGFSIQDPEVDHMSRAYAGARSIYYVLEDGGRVLGGAGIVRDAGVQDQAVNPPSEALGRLANAGGDGVGVGQVQPNEFGADAPGDLPARFAATGNNHAGSGLREVLRHAQPDAGRAADDQNAVTLNAERIRHDRAQATARVSDTGQSSCG